MCVRARTHVSVRDCLFLSSGISTNSHTTPLFLVSCPCPFMIIETLNTLVVCHMFTYVDIKGFSSVYLRLSWAVLKFRQNKLDLEGVMPKWILKE